MKQGNDFVACFFANVHVPVLCLLLVSAICHAAFVFPTLSHSSLLLLLASLGIGSHASRCFSSVKTLDCTMWSTGKDSAVKKQPDPEAILDSDF